MLDPIVAIRVQIALEPEESATVNIVTGLADTREACLALVDKYHDRRLADRVFELAWTHSQVVLRQLNATEADAQLYGRLAGSVLYPTPPSAPIRGSSRGTGAANRGSGATPSPAICRSCCCRSPTRRASTWCASWCRPTPTGGSRAWPWIW